MNSRPLASVFARCGLALLVLSGAGRLTAQEPQAPPAADAATANTLSADQLQSLVAPIALYPDELLAQTLVASTYPLEVIQLQQWMAKHPDLEDEALADSVATQPWDAAIQSMAAVPEVVERLADDIQWTTELGNAFLAQQADVMDAVQAMRKKAEDKGALESNEQQTVETQTVEGTTVIVVESANPEVVYVPSYNPAYVYPPPVYAYPPIYYPPYTAGAAFVSFSIGVMWGAAIWGGSCCHAGWGGNDIYINNTNNFNQIDRGDGNRGDGNRGDGNRGDGNRGDGNRGDGNRGDGNRGDGNRGQGGRGDSWQHNPEHRGAAPYGDQRTADKFGGSSRGQGAGAGTGVSNRAAGGAGAGAGVSNRSAAGTSGSRSAAGTSGSRSAAGTSGSRGGESIGNRSIPSGSQSSGFSGGASGFSGSRARASSSRGASSMSRSRGGGGRRR